MFQAGDRIRQNDNGRTGTVIFATRPNSDGEQRIEWVRDTDPGNEHRIGSWAVTKV